MLKPGGSDERVLYSPFGISLSKRKSCLGVFMIAGVIGVGDGTACGTLTLITDNRRSTGGDRPLDDQ